MFEPILQGGMDLLFLLRLCWPWTDEGYNQLVRITSLRSEDTEFLRAGQQFFHYSCSTSFEEMDKRIDAECIFKIYGQHIILVCQYNPSGQFSLLTPGLNGSV